MELLRSIFSSEVADWISRFTLCTTLAVIILRFSFTERARDRIVSRLTSWIEHGNSRISRKIVKYLHGDGSHHHC